MTAARTRTLKAILTHPSTGKLLVNERVSIRLYTGLVGWIDDDTVSGETTTAVVGETFAWTNDVGLLAVPDMACNVDVQPTNTAYSIQLVKRSTPLVFVLPPDAENNTDAWLFDNLVPDPSNPDPVVAGATEEYVDDAIATQHESDNGTYAPISSTWEANTDVFAGQLISHGSNLYEAAIDFTTPATFDTVHLTAISGGGGGGAVSTVFGRTGDIVATTGDYTAAQVGAQPVDSDLSAIAALTTTAFGRALLTLADAAAMRTTAGLVIGTDVQAHDADLDAIAALATTTYGRALLTLANQAALLTAVGAGANSGVATLDSGGKIPAGQIPQLAINQVFTVASQAAMLALSANPGDIAVRTDTSPTSTFMLASAPASTLGNWVQISIDAAPVTSVAGKTGAVTLTADDITNGTTNKVYSATEQTKLAGIATSADVTGTAINAATAKTTPVDADTMPLSDSAASGALKKVTWANIKATLKTYLDTLYVPVARQVITGSGLTGGGALSGDLTISVTGSTVPIRRDTVGAPVILSTDKVGDYAYDAAAAIEYGPLVALSGLVTGHGWNTATESSAVVVPITPNAAQTYDLISGWTSESVARGASLIDQVTMVSGTLLMARVFLAKGTVVSHFGFEVGGTGASSPTHSWMGLYDLNRVQLAVTADAGSTAIGTFQIPTVRAVATTAAGAASSFTTTYSGLHYIGFVVVASGAPKLYGLPSNPGMNNAPGLGGTSDTGITAGPPGFPHTASSITFIGSPLAHMGTA